VPGIYNYILETNHVSRVYSVAAILGYMVLQLFCSYNLCYIIIIIIIIIIL